MSKESFLEAFLDFTERRGIPPRFRSVYEAEVFRILSRHGASSIDELDGSQLATSVREAEAKLQTTRATCVALDAFLREEFSGDLTIHDDPTATEDPPFARRDQSEHRRYPRVPFRTEVFMVGSTSTGRTSDLSEGGMYLETNQYLEVGDRLQLRFRLRSEDDLLTVVGRVVFCDPGVGAGVDFVDITPGQRLAIRSFIREVVA